MTLTVNHNYIHNQIEAIKVKIECLKKSLKKCESTLDFLQQTTDKINCPSLQKENNMESISNKRVRCSDEEFLQAVFTSTTYAEVAEKTGQKIATTVARYNKIKNSLKNKNINLPEMQRPRNRKSGSENIESIVKIVKRLKEIYHT